MIKYLGIHGLDKLTHRVNHHEDQSQNALVWIILVKWKGSSNNSCRRFGRSKQELEDSKAIVCRGGVLFRIGKTWHIYILGGIFSKEKNGWCRRVCISRPDLLGRRETLAWCENLHRKSAQFFIAKIYIFSVLTQRQYISSVVC